ncbi:MAG: uracil-DNA glycosylase family protein [Bradyrhizobium sp.]|uniref:uracil-DNA glycosylase family protein n=1 Tax=Bradyrhizobium sp. TaxID=376 RepID=UPI003D1523BD
MTSKLDLALAEIRRCDVCAAHMPHAPRPVVQAARGARVVIVGQAPGSKVHESGVPWRDQSGDRLREWTGLDESVFYDASRVALIPMGFCYPGTANGADLPPRPECAPLWHKRLLALLPTLQLTLLVGIHAQGHYLRKLAKPTMTETVRASADYGPAWFPLPHPSWRSTGWMRRNPWFEADILPALRRRVRSILAR